MRNDRYDVGIAIANMAVAEEDTSDQELKGILAAGSDIPEDRLDFALNELKQGLPTIRMLMLAFEFANGRPPSIQEIAEDILQSATWVDDEKKNFHVETQVIDENGETVATAEANIRLD